MTPLASSPVVPWFILPTSHALDLVLKPWPGLGGAGGASLGVPVLPPAPPSGLQLQEKDTGPKCLMNETWMF